MNLNLSNHNEIVKCLGWLAGSARIGYECLPMTKRWLICFYFEFLWNNLRKASESNLFSHRICRNSFSVLLKLSLQVGLANLIGGGGEMKNYSGEKAYANIYLFSMFLVVYIKSSEWWGCLLSELLSRKLESFRFGKEVAEKRTFDTINNY